MKTVILRNVYTGWSGPTNGSFGTDFLNYFSKLWWGGSAPMPKIKISVELNDMGGKGCKIGKGCSLF